MASPASPICPQCGALLVEDWCTSCGCDPQRTHMVSPGRGEAPPAAAGGAAPGDAERYEVLDTLGRGGMGVVYRVLDRDLDEVIALKVLEPEVEVPLALERFKQELKIARRINHPNIARLHDLVRWRGRWAISQEFIDGPSLAQVLGDGPLPVDRIRRLLRPLCSALAAAHALGVVHRDLKPANILVQKGDQPRILDFGLATLVGSASQDSQGFIIGTPTYMSPEQAFAPEKVDHRSDLYSLGVILFYMATGQVPFTGRVPRDILFAHLEREPPDPCSLRPDLPQAFREVVLRLLEKEPEARYGSAREPLDRLEALLARERPAEAAGVTPSASRGTVLLVDDDPDLRALMGAILRRAGCRILEAEDGVTGVEAAIAGQPDLVLLDILMPRLDGRDALRILKSTRATASIPVVMVTSLTDREEAMFSRESGAAAFLNKPIQPDVLELLADRYLPARPAA